MNNPNQKQRSLRNEYQREYYQKHQEKMRAYHREWYQKHKKQKAKYRREHKVELSAYQKQYRAEHTEEQKAYRETHKEGIKSYKKRKIERGIYKRKGEFLKGRLEELGKNQSWLAKQLGVTTQSISSYLRGIYLPKNENLKNLCRILRIKPKDLEDILTSSTP